MEHIELAKKLARHTDDPAVLALCEAVSELDRVPAKNEHLLTLAKACLPDGMHYTRVQIAACWLGISCIEATECWRAMISARMTEKITARNGTTLNTWGAERFTALTGFCSDGTGAPAASPAISGGKRFLMRRL